MPDHATRLFDFDRRRPAREESVELVKRYASAEFLRSAQVEELELDEDFYRRPVRPEDLSFIRFAEPVTSATVERLPFLAAQRLLLSINELELARLPADADPERFQQFLNFYGGDHRALASRVRPFLDDFAFDFLCRSGSEATTTEDCAQRLSALLRSEADFWDDILRHLKRTGYLQQGLRFILIQKWSLASSKRSAFAKAAALGYLDLLGADDRPRMPRLPDDDAMLDRLAAICGAGKKEHSYWQFYLSTSLAECNLLHALASRADRALHFHGAAFAAEAAWSAFRGFIDQVRASLGDPENDAGCGRTIPAARDLISRFRRAVETLEARYGARATWRVAEGLAVADRLAASARRNLGEQLRWLASVDQYRDIAQAISARIEAECPDIDRETFVEPKEMCSTTHVHDDHRLVVIETGKMVFWGNLGMTLRLSPGEMVLVPEGRLHGSSIESDECVYHQPIIPDDWVRALVEPAQRALLAS